MKFEKQYLIRSYECDRDGQLRILTLLNIFQDIAGTHAHKMGVGLNFCMQHNFAWVCSGYHIKINKLPKMHQKIIVITWTSSVNRLTAVRDLSVVSKTGEVLINASSQWVLLNIERKRPISILENLPEYDITPERALDTDFPKIDDVKKADVETEFAIRYDDIDLNNHVNNAVYALWASESVGTDFRTKHSVAELEILFRKEANLGEKVEVLTHMNGYTSVSSIISRTDERKLCKARIKWRKM